MQRVALGALLVLKHDLIHDLSDLRLGGAADVDVDPVGHLVGTKLLPEELVEARHDPLRAAQREPVEMLAPPALADDLRDFPEVVLNVVLDAALVVGLRPPTLVVPAVDLILEADALRKPVRGPRK